MTGTKQKKAYIGPADGDTAEELGKVPPCLRNSPARSQVVAGCQKTDCLGCPSQNCVQHLRPQLSCRCPGSGHDAKGERSPWHRHETISDGSQVRGTDQQNKLQNKAIIVMCEEALIQQITLVYKL